MIKFVQQLVVVASMLLLSSCVTQNFEKDNQIIENSASNNELAMTRISLGLGYLKMGNNTQAKFNLEKAKKFAPNLSEVYTAFAHYYETVEEPELTVASYEKSLSIKADDANTLNNYGVYLCRQEQYLEAEVQFLKAITIPSYLLVSESYENLALCQLKAEHFDKAEMYLSKAIIHSPSRSSALFQMVRLQYAMGNYIKAREYERKFEKATNRFTTESLALAMKVYQKLGDHKTAKNYGSMLVKMYPNSWESQQYILNGLERIDADVLAEQYQKKSYELGKQHKKRVVVLSPNKNNDNFVQSKNVSNKLPVDIPLPVDKKVVMQAPVVIAEVDEPLENINNSVDENVTDSSISLPKEVESELISTDILPILVAEQEVVTAIDDNGEIPEDEGGTEALAIDSENVNNATFPQSNESIEQSKMISSEAETIEIPVHKVVKGENLYGISVKYNILLNTLKKWNKLDESSKIKIGDKLFLAEPVQVVSDNE